MGSTKTHWDAWVATVDGWLNGYRHHAFYNGDRRASGEPAEAVARAPRESIAPRLLAALMLVSAVVMLMFVAASAIVNSFSARTVTRLTHAKVEQLAAAEYRKARSQCQQLSSAPREACIAEAHAAEDRARAVATMTRHDYIRTLRAQTDAAIDAGDRDAIVIEPACNVVARGQGSLCEIQVKPNQLALPGTNLIPATVRSQQFAINAPPPGVAPVHQRQQPHQVRLQPESPAPARFIVVAQPERRMMELAWSTRQ